MPKSITSENEIPQEFTTTQATYSSHQIVTDTEIFFPDFCKSWTILNKSPSFSTALLHIMMSSSDAIFWRAFFFYHGQNSVSWDGLTIPMHRVSHASPPLSAITSFSCAHTAHSIYAATAMHILHMPSTIILHQITSSDNASVYSNLLNTSCINYFPTSHVYSLVDLVIM